MYKRQILGKAPEVVFCPNYYQEVGQILAQAESIGLAVPFLGGDVYKRQFECCGQCSTTSPQTFGLGTFFVVGGTGLEQFLPGYGQKTNKGRVSP